jgi:hypothetical protein
LPLGRPSPRRGEIDLRSRLRDDKVTGWPPSWHEPTRIRPMPQRVDRAWHRVALDAPGRRLILAATTT